MCMDSSNRKIDTCMKVFIRMLKGIFPPHLKILACCCGHGIYPMTIVVRNLSKKHNFELVNGVLIPRKKRFYVKDKGGFYYIPETIENG